MSFEKEIPSIVEVVNILGINDKNLKYIKSIFPNVMINVRGNTIFIDGQDKDAKEIMRIFDRLNISIHRVVLVCGLSCF